MNIVLLPGMDGTGLLFEPFIAQAPDHYRVTPIPLKQNPGISYSEQAEHIRTKIYEEPTIIVAESYSGRVAYELALTAPAHIKHIVFAASFLGRPSFIAKFPSLIPLHLIRSGMIPSSITGRLAFGNSKSDHLVRILNKSLKQVDIPVLRQRLKQIAELEPPEESINLPCTYIRPQKDYLVQPGALKVFNDVCPNLRIRELDGSHFILQSNPDGCWKVIQEIAQRPLSR